MKKLYVIAVVGALCVVIGAAVLFVPTVRAVSPTTVPTSLPAGNASTTLPAGNASTTLSAGNASTTLPPGSGGGVPVPVGVFVHLSRTDELWDEYSALLISIGTTIPEAITFLEEARQTNTGLVVVLATGKKYRNPDGSFSFTLWKQQLDRFIGLDFAPYVADGTVIAHYMMDEPKHATKWGAPISNRELEQMAEYSKQLFPSLPTTVRHEPTLLAESNWEWEHLDSAWAQFHSRKGPVEEYIAGEVASAQAQNLGLIVGINALDGGDGSSGFLSPRSVDQWAMSAAEIVEYGRALIDAGSSCAFLAFTYPKEPEDVYLNRPEIAEAMQDLVNYGLDYPAGHCGLR